MFATITLINTWTAFWYVFQISRRFVVKYPQHLSPDAAPADRIIDLIDNVQAVGLKSIHLVSELKELKTNLQVALGELERAKALASSNSD